MGKPTEEELNQALTEASRMREQDDDPHYVAKALLNTHYRFKQLEKVLQAIEHYLHSGQAAHEHTRLVKAINEYHAADNRSGGEDADSFTLR